MILCGSCANVGVARILHPARTHDSRAHSFNPAQSLICVCAGRMQDNEMLNVAKVILPFIKFSPKLNRVSLWDVKKFTNPGLGVLRFFLFLTYNPC